MRPGCFFYAVFLLAVAVAVSTQAATFYVNNRTGSDGSDGRVDETINNISGPVRSIGRALQLASYADTIVVANTGMPYRESISLVGRKHSGAPGQPFHIIGNGVELVGTHPVPESGWQTAGKDLWKIVPHRKGHFVLTQNSGLLPELRPTPGETWRELPALEVNTWCAWRGAIYYQSEPSAIPAELDFGVALEPCGITLFHTRNVLIQDLNIRHFRLDGINAHDVTDGVELRNITLSENGRAGLSVNGSAVVTLKESAVSGNRDYSVLIQELGGLDLQDSTLDVEPVVKE